MKTARFFVATFLALCLALPNSALALRGKSASETSTRAGLEESLGKPPQRSILLHPLNLAAWILEGLLKDDQTGLIVVSRSWASRRYLGDRIISAEALPEINRILADVLLPMAPLSKGMFRSHGLWNSEIAWALRRRGVIGFILTEENISYETYSQHPASVAGRLLEELSRRKELTGLVSLSYRQFNTLVPSPKLGSRFLTNHPNWLEEMRSLLSLALGEREPDRGKTPAAYLLWHSDAARTLRNRPVVVSVRPIEKTDPVLVAQEIIEWAAQELSRNKRLLWYREDGWLNFPCEFVGKLGPTFPSGTALRLNGGKLRLRMNRALRQNFPGTSQAAQIFRAHGIHGIRIVVSVVGHGAFYRPKPLAERIVQALPEALPKNPSLRIGSTVLLSYRDAGVGVLENINVSNAFTKQPALAPSTNRVFKRILLGTSEAVRWLKDEGIDRILIKKAVQGKHPTLTAGLEEDWTDRLYPTWERLAREQFAKKGLPLDVESAPLYRLVGTGHPQVVEGLFKELAHFAVLVRDTKANGKFSSPLVLQIHPLPPEKKETLGPLVLILKIPWALENSADARRLARRLEKHGWKGRRVRRFSTAFLTSWDPAEYLLGPEIVKGVERLRAKSRHLRDQLLVALHPGDSLKVGLSLDRVRLWEAAKERAGLAYDSDLPYLKQVSSMTLQEIEQDLLKEARAIAAEGWSGAGLHSRLETLALLLPDGEKILQSFLSSLKELPASDGAYQGMQKALSAHLGKINRSQDPPAVLLKKLQVFPFQAYREWLRRGPLLLKTTLRYLKLARKEKFYKEMEVPTPDLSEGEELRLILKDKKGLLGKEALRIRRRGTRYFYEMVPSAGATPSFGTGVPSLELEEGPNHAVILFQYSPHLESEGKSPVTPRLCVERQGDAIRLYHWRDSSDLNWVIRKAPAAGLEEKRDRREAAMAADLKSGARRQVVEALEKLYDAEPASVGTEALVFTRPDTFELVPLAIRWGWNVAVLSDEPQAADLEALLDSLPAELKKGRYAIGIGKASLFLDQFPEHTWINTRQKGLLVLGLPSELEGLPEAETQVLQAVRTFLELSV